MMRRHIYIIVPFLFVLLLISCNSPTTPSTVKPVIDITDPRYDGAFFQMFAMPLGFVVRPFIVNTIRVLTIDDEGTPISDELLQRTGADVLETASILTGWPITLAYGPGLGIVIEWKAGREAQGGCGSAQYAGSLVTLYYKTPGFCTCSNGMFRPIVARHEIGHALGFGHTDQTTDLMHPGGQSTCDQGPSAREIYHAQLAYRLPIGSGRPQ